jgi:hypothetical protein
MALRAISCAASQGGTRVSARRGVRWGYPVLRPLWQSVLLGQHSLDCLAQNRKLFYSIPNNINRNFIVMVRQIIPKTLDSAPRDFWVSRRTVFGQTLNNFANNLIATNNSVLCLFIMVKDRTAFLCELLYPFHIGQ